MGNNVFCCHELFNEDLQKRHPSIALVTKRFKTVEPPAHTTPEFLPTSPTSKEWDFCRDEKMPVEEEKFPEQQNMEENMEAI